MNGKKERIKREGEDWGGRFFRRENRDLVRRGFDGECGRVADEEIRVGEIELLRIAVPKQGGCFLLMRENQRFGLEVGIGLTVQAVIHGDG